MSGKASRLKGHNFERWLVNAVKAIWVTAHRGLAQTRDGAEVCDVEGTPYWIECKRGKKTNIRAALRQASDATEAHRKAAGAILYRPPIAVCKDDRQPPTVTMYLDDWLILASQAQEGGYSD